MQVVLSRVATPLIRTLETRSTVSYRRRTVTQRVEVMLGPVVAQCKALEQRRKARRANLPQERPNPMEE